MNQTVNFDELLEKFNKSYVATFISTDFLGMKINWKFEKFPIILLKPTFLSYLQNTFDYSFTFVKQNEIEENINFLRDLFNMVNQASITYLSELNNEIVIENLYQRFLLSIYTDLKKFINDIFIKWILFSITNENFKIGINEYRLDSYFVYNKELLRLEFQKSLLRIIKTIAKTNQDETFKILENSYEDDILKKQLRLKTMKNSIQIK